MNNRSADLDLQSGDLIGIPVNDRLYAVSQVHHPGTVFFLVVYNLYKENLDVRLDELLTRPLLASWTTDAELYRKRWIGPVSQKIPVKPISPIYKVHIKGKLVVEDVNGNFLRDFDPKTDSELTYRVSRSPITVEKFVKAIYSGGKLPDYGRDMIL